MTENELKFLNAFRLEKAALFGNYTCKPSEASWSYAIHFYAKVSRWCSFNLVKAYLIPWIFCDGMDATQPSCRECFDYVKSFPKDPFNDRYPILNHDYFLKLCLAKFESTLVKNGVADNIGIKIFNVTWGPRSKMSPPIAVFLDNFARDYSMLYTSFDLSNSKGDNSEDQNKMYYVFAYNILDSDLTAQIQKSELNRNNVLQNRLQNWTLACDEIKAFCEGKTSKEILNQYVFIGGNSNNKHKLDYAEEEYVSDRKIKKNNSDSHQSKYTSSESKNPKGNSSKKEGKQFGKDSCKICGKNGHKADACYKRKCKNPLCNGISHEKRKGVCWRDNVKDVEEEVEVETIPKETKAKKAKVSKQGIISIDSSIINLQANLKDSKEELKPESDPKEIIVNKFININENNSLNPLLSFNNLNILDGKQDIVENVINPDVLIPPDKILPMNTNVNKNINILEDLEDSLNNLVFGQVEIQDPTKVHIIHLGIDYTMNDVKNVYTYYDSV